MPDISERKEIPILWFLSGLTCNHENAMTKSGAQTWAAEKGLAVIFPDTSPRGSDVPDDDSFDLGQGAGFYLDASEDPWSKNFNMETYIKHELSELVFKNFNLDKSRQGITGHSMGGNAAIRGVNYFGKQATKNGTKSKLHSVYVSGYVLTLRENILKASK